jgi:hypothetical protein
MPVLPPAPSVTGTTETEKARNSGAGSTRRRGIDPAIVSEIRQASNATQVDFSYMMAQAATESDFQPTAKAATSSATGLYQFIDSTWLESVKQYGARYGLGRYAQAISETADGPHVADPALRQTILDLRNDPGISASLAAELARSNRQTVEQGLGHPANATDLYLAHFLGAAGATRLVKTIESNASVSAASLLPQAAEANRSVFYDTAGQARTVGQIYSHFSQKLESQISQFGGSVGDSGDVTLARDDVASGALSAMPFDLSAQASQPLLTMMNIMEMAALKLLAQEQSGDLSPDSEDEKRRKQLTAGI